MSDVHPVASLSALCTQCVWLHLECVLVGSQARIFEKPNQADGGDTNCA